MPTPLAEHAIRGLGPGRLRRLAEAGITTVEGLASADPTVVASLPYFGPEIAQMVVAAASAVVDPPVSPAAEAAVGAAVEASVDTSSRPAPEAAGTLAPGPRSTGDKAARRVERSRDLAEQAHAHAGQAEEAGKAKDAGQAKKARKELRKLVEALETTVSQVAEKGISRTDYGQVKKQLGKLDDALGALLSRKPRAKWLRRTARAAKDVRKYIAGNAD